MPVYVIAAGEANPTQFVKIGWAVDPEQRLRELQCAHYEPLRIIRLMDGGPETEAWLHRRFAAFRKLGEWFRFDAAMLSVIPPPIIELRSPVDPVLSEVIRLAGGASQLSRQLGITQGAVSQWDRVPVERAKAVSRLTKIPLHQLRPDIWDAPTMCEASALESRSAA